MRPVISSQRVAPPVGEAVAPGRGDLNNGERVDLGRGVPAGRGVRVARRMGIGELVGVGRGVWVVLGVAAAAARVGRAGTDCTHVNAHASATTTTRTSREKTSATRSGADW